MGNARQNLLDALEVLSALKEFVDPSREDDILRAWEKARDIAEKAAEEYVESDA
jgi:hypothetical protein